jgi:hypothetical protein
MARTTFFSSVLLTACAAAAQTAVSPADRATFEGSSFTHFPLGRFNARLQQLHGDVPSGMIVHGHAYRRDAAQIRGRVDAFATDLQVTLSTSPNGPAQAASAFANNVGPDAVVVLPRTVLSFPATDRPALDPAPAFELVVPYQVPFVLGAGTLCVDTVIFGNTTTGGANRNFNVYHDAHTFYANGRSEQEGYRTGTGCPPAGGTAAAYATMTLWNLGTSVQIDVAGRNGVPDVGGTTRQWIALGLQQANLPWAARPECAMQTSGEVWFAMPGTLDGNGSYDGSLTNLPLLPSGYRLWCQSGSIDLTDGNMAFGDLSGFMTPPAAPTAAPAARVASSSDRSATTGTVSQSVTVTRFF